MRLIAIALLSVVLPVMTVPSHAKRCTVTVVLADHAGNQQPKGLVAPAKQAAG